MGGKKEERGGGKFSLANPENSHSSSHFSNVETTKTSNFECSTTSSPITYLPNYQKCQISTNLHNQHSSFSWGSVNNIEFRHLSSFEYGNAKNTKIFEDSTTLYYNHHHQQALLLHLYGIIHTWRNPGLYYLDFLKKKCASWREKRRAEDLSWLFIQSLSFFTLVSHYCNKNNNKNNKMKQLKTC